MKPILFINIGGMKRSISSHKDRFHYVFQSLLEFKVTHPNVHVKF